MSLQLNGDTGVTFNDASLQGAAASPFGLKNRLINSDMRIDQRNAGASVSYAFTTAYSLDRWRVRTDSDGVVSVQQVSDAPTGFVNSLKTTVTTIDSSLGASQSYFLSQLIEGNNIADLDWGLSTAKTVTLSFWVKSSVTGTFGGSLENSAENRAYPFTYAISSANTWEQKSVTITGDTTGTWLTTNGVGIRLNFGWGVGSTLSGTANAWAAADYRSATGATNLMATLSATWQVTGVQLEQNTSATPFERRLYGQELANCQRYYAKSYAQGTVPGTSTNLNIAAQSSGGGGSYTDLLTVTLPVIMRAAVTVSFWDTVGNSSKITRIIANSQTTNSVGSSAFESDRAFSLYGSSGIANSNGLYSHWVASAEL
jgi:hypothetical protein